MSMPALAAYCRCLRTAASMITPSLCSAGTTETCSESAGCGTKCPFFEASARVPLLVHYPQRFTPHHVSQNVSTLDILPTLVDLVSARLVPGLPLDGLSLLPHLRGEGGHDTVFGEYR
eukprot:Colp12_sorted_trinity150504_noHs@34405